MFKSITFDCEKEFSNWKNVSNSEDISIFFADPGCPSQKGLNEHCNGLLRRDGLAKKTDFRALNESDIVSVASYSIPRKSLNYNTIFVIYTFSFHWQNKLTRHSFVVLSDSQLF